jgi:hypothetical protein
MACTRRHDYIFVPALSLFLILVTYTRCIKEHDTSFPFYLAHKHTHKHTRTRLLPYFDVEILYLDHLATRTLKWWNGTYPFY